MLVVLKNCKRKKKKKKDRKTCQGLYNYVISVRVSASFSANCYRKSAELTIAVKREGDEMY